MLRLRAPQDTHLGYQWAWHDCDGKVGKCCRRYHSNRLGLLNVERRLMCLHTIISTRFELYSHERHLKFDERHSSRQSSMLSTSWCTLSTVFKILPFIFLNSHNFVGSSMQLFSRYSDPSCSRSDVSEPSVMRSISESSHCFVVAWKVADLWKRRFLGHLKQSSYLWFSKLTLKIILKNMSNKELSKKFKAPLRWGARARRV